MRDLRAGRDLQPDGRLLSIRRISQRPTVATFTRPSQGSTIDGPSAPTVVCTVTGRFDPYGLMKRSGMERANMAGRSSEIKYRFEVPYPTDQNDATVNIQRGDVMAISGDSRVYHVIEVIFGIGYIECMLDSWD